MTVPSAPEPAAQPDGGPWIAAQGDHVHLVSVRQDGELIEFELLASPDLLGRVDAADEPAAVAAAVTYLLDRQRADELPSYLDLDDIVGAYDDFEDYLGRATRSGTP